MNSCDQQISSSANNYILSANQITLLSDPDMEFNTQYDPLVVNRHPNNKMICTNKRVKVEIALDSELHQCLQAVDRAASLRTKLQSLHDKCTTVNRIPEISKERSEFKKNVKNKSNRLGINLGCINELDNLKLLQAGVATSLKLMGFQCVSRQALDCLIDCAACFLKKLAERLAQVFEDQQKEHNGCAGGFPDAVQRALAEAGIYHGYELGYWREQWVIDNKRRLDDICKSRKKELDCYISQENVFYNSDLSNKNE